MCPILYLLYARDVALQYNAGWSTPGIGFALATPPTLPALQQCVNADGTYMTDPLVVISYADDDNHTATTVDGLRANLAAAQAAAAAVTATTLNVGATKSASHADAAKAVVEDTRGTPFGNDDGSDDRRHRRTRRRRGHHTATSAHPRGHGVQPHGGVWDDAAKGVAWLSDLHRRKKRNGWNGIKYAYLRSNISVHSITVAVARWKQFTRSCWTLRM